MPAYIYREAVISTAILVENPLEYPMLCCTYRVENGHTIVVVQTRGEVVHSEGVDTQLLHENGISEAGVSIGERVSGATEPGRAARLVSICLLAPSIG